MKKWNLSVIMFAVAAFIFTMSGMQPAIGADAPGKVEKTGKDRQFGRDENDEQNG